VGVVGVVDGAGELLHWPPNTPTWQLGVGVGFGEVPQFPLPWPLPLHDGCGLGFPQNGACFGQTHPWLPPPKPC
jgi:hypothetical protein